MGYLNLVDINKIFTGVARLPSARAVKRMVKSYNERNSCLYLKLFIQEFNILRNFFKSTVVYKAKEGEN